MAAIAVQGAFTEIERLLRAHSLVPIPDATLLRAATRQPFDTHVNQAVAHDRQLQYCADAIEGFFREPHRTGAMATE